MSEKLQQQLAEIIKTTREKQPLIPSITNMVTVNGVANAQIAIGGSPAMLHLPDEGENLAQSAGAFYINMGTLLPVYAETIPRTISRLQELHIPWALDPVGLNKGALHQSLIQYMKQHPPKLIKGNASEILLLAQAWEIHHSTKVVSVKGVDTQNEVSEALPAAIALARFIAGAVIVTGATDVVTDGETIIYSSGGSEWLTKITGAGCMLGGVSAVLLSGGEPLAAAVAAVNAFNLAGKAVAAKATGPAHYQQLFLDALYQLTPNQISQHSLREELVVQHGNA